MALNSYPPKIEAIGQHYKYHCSNERTFLFDECDLPYFMKTLCHVNERGYVTTNRKKDLISHILLSVDNKAVVDHINGDPTDNRRKNLRVVTNVQNHWNYGVSSRNTTGFKEIYKDSKSAGYHARICENGRRHYLGLFPTASEAAQAYDRAARQYFGEYATLNYPEAHERAFISQKERSS